MLATIELMKATVDGMAACRFGRVTKITPSAVKVPIDFLGLSDGARSGLRGFVAGLARTRKLAQANVTMNSLLPGGFHTGRLKVTMGQTGKNYEVEAANQMDAIPARRFTTPEECGAVCASRQ
jgi:3-oxoacyl-[acyl-carrier protein] reductase